MGHIAIADCSVKTLAIPCFNRLVQKFDRSFSYHLPPIAGVSSLEEDQDAEAYIIFGSNSNVEDRLPWQQDLAKWMKQKILEGRPVIGICFGHQLMADSFGGEIQKHADQKSLQGVRKLEIIKNGWGFEVGEHFSVATAHSYQVVKKPDDFMALGESPDCRYDILAHKTLPYIGFQGHPEASKTFYKNEITQIQLSPEKIQEGQQGGDLLLTRVFKFLKN